MILRSPVRALFLIAALVCCISACGEDDGGTGPGPGGSTDVGPAGGTVQSADGSFTLTVPAGALTSTQSITIEPIDPVDLPAAFDTVTVEAAFDLKPDGLEFDVPVAVSFRSSQAAFPSAGQIRLEPEMIFTLDDTGALEPLSEGKMEADAEDGTVVISGETDHFSPFVCISDRALGEGNSGLVIEARILEVQDNFAYDIGTTITYDGEKSRYQLPVVQRSLTDPLYATPGGNGVWTANLSEFQGGMTATHTERFSCQQEGAHRARLRFETQISASVSFDMEMSFEAVCPPSVDPGDEEFEFTVGVGPELATMLRLSSKDWDDQPADEFDLALVSGSTGTKIYDMDLKSVAYNVNANGQWYGSIALADPATSGDFTSGVVSYGPSGGSWVGYSTENGLSNFALLFGFQSAIWDATNYDDDPDTGGMVYVQGGSMIKFAKLEGPSGFNADGANIDASSLDFATTGSIVGALRRTGFKRTAGGIVSDVLVVTAGDQTVGKVYLASTANPSASLTALVDVGTDPRRARMAGDIVAVSNFGSDDLTVLNWNASGVTVMEASIGVGDGPVGIDLVELANGNVAICSTGFEDDTYSITLVDGSGKLVSSTTSAVPLEGDAPGHATWAQRGDTLYVVISCNGNDKVVVAPTDLVP